MMKQLLGVDTEEITKQLEEALTQFKRLCMLTEQNREMLRFLCEKLSDEEKEKLQNCLDEVCKRYETGDN